MDYTSRRVKELEFKLKQNKGSMSQDEIDECEESLKWCSQMPQSEPIE